MLSWVGPENIITWVVGTPTGRSTFGLKSIVKDGILETGQKDELYKNGWTNLNDLYVV